MSKLYTAATFGTALDEFDFETLILTLDESCTFKQEDQIVRGLDKIVNTIRNIGSLKNARIDKNPIQKCRVQQISDGSFIVHLKGLPIKKEPNNIIHLKLRVLVNEEYLISEMEWMKNDLGS